MISFGNMGQCGIRSMKAPIAYRAPDRQLAVMKSDTEGLTWVTG